MGYTEFQGPEAVNREIARMGLDTDRCCSLKGDGLLHDQAPAVTPDLTNNGPANPTLG